MQKLQLNNMYAATNEFEKMGNTEELEALIIWVAKVYELSFISVNTTR